MWLSFVDLRHLLKPVARNINEHGRVPFLCRSHSSETHDQETNGSSSRSCDTASLSNGSFLLQIRSQQIFSVKTQTVNIFCFAGHVWSVTYSLLFFLILYKCKIYQLMGCTETGHGLDLTHCHRLLTLALDCVIREATGRFQAIRITCPDFCIQNGTEVIDQGQIRQKQKTVNWVIALCKT